MTYEELEEDTYIIITKDILTMGVPKGTLGIIKTILEPELLESNAPYVCIVETIPDMNLAVSLDEIEPTTILGNRRARRA